MVFTAPAGYEYSEPFQGGDPAADSNADGTGTSDCTTLESGETDTTVDAGLYRPASIGDLVWNDLNGNGVQDAGEPPVQGAVVSLADCDGNEVFRIEWDDGLITSTDEEEMEAGCDGASSNNSSNYP